MCWFAEKEAEIYNTLNSQQFLKILDSKIKLEKLTILIQKSLKILELPIHS
jgi:hypothetical protein